MRNSVKTNSVMMICNKRSLTVLALQNAEVCVSWLQAEGLIPTSPPCLVCNAPMRTRVRGDRQVSYRCQRKIAGIVHEIQKNALEKTFFEGTKISLIDVLTVIYYFSWRQTSIELLVRECRDGDRVVSSGVVAKWLSYCREACLIWLYNECDRDELLGGEGADVLVEVDLCRIGKRRCTALFGENTWLLGLIEVTKNQKLGRFRLELCGEDATNPDVLIPLVARLTRSGTRLDTKLWGSRWELSRDTQHHYIVNDSQTDVTNVNRSNAYSIGSLWQANRPSGKLKEQNMALYLAEFLYRREVRLSEQDPFAHFLKVLRAPFPNK